MPRERKAVFLSYASEDSEAAGRIAECLKGAGVEVWFDKSELRGGDAWDRRIREQIKECGIFVPLISAHTDARSEGYFRREWNLAVDRMLDIADDRAFLLPVVIDGTAQATARVPDRFRDRQWSRVIDEAAAVQWAGHVAELLGAPTSAGSADTARPLFAPAFREPRRRWVTPALSAAGLLVAIEIGLGITMWRGRDAAVPVGPAPSPKAAAAAAVALDPKSVAVLPFDNLSGRAEDAYLADGLQEEVLNALARVRELKVISRTSTLEYRDKTANVREIGQRLNVGTVLEGSVRREGNTLRLTVQLIDARSDRHLFAANYDRDMAKLLELQSAVARQVAEALSATLTKSEHGEFDRIATNNGDAYDRYLKAVALFRRPAPGDDLGVVESKRLLEEAVRLDPGYADAFALLSQANTWLYLEYPAEDQAAAARQAYERALAIDPLLPEARLARAMYALYVSLDPERALSELEPVATARPSWAEAHALLGFALRRRGRMDEALDHLVHASDLDPLNETYAGPPVTTLLGLRRFPEAIARIDLNQRRFPGDPERESYRAYTEAQMRHDVEPVRAALRNVGPSLGRARRAWLESEVAIAEGRYLDAVPLQDARDDLDTPQRDVQKGLLYYAASDGARAQRSFHDAARTGLDRVRHEPALAGSINFAPFLAIAQSMLGEHAAAIATIDAAQARSPESRDAVNGPYLSFVRSIILVRAGRKDEGYAEVDRLLRVPFGSPLGIDQDSAPLLLLVKDDQHFDELVNRPPRL